MLDDTVSGSHLRGEDIKFPKHGSRCAKTTYEENNLTNIA